MPLRGPVPVVTTWEYGPVILPRGLETPATRERLETAALRAGVRAFEVRGRRLFALGAVGVVDIGNLVVEILPKTHDRAAPSEGAAFLGDLLRFAGTDVDLGLSEAGIATGEGGLLEIVLGWAARTASDNLWEGAPRRYAVREEMSTAVRGRIQLGRMVRQRPGRAFELTIRHAPFSEDNPVSRIIRWLISEIAARTRSLRTRALCLRLLHDLQAVTTMTPSEADLDRVTLSSLESRWISLLALARLFLRQGRPDPARGGCLNAVAILFTLHDLFEAALKQVLSRGSMPNLRTLGGAEKLLRPSTEGPHIVGLKPDFQLGRIGSPNEVVGDAKWKRIFEREGPPRLRESDAHQLTTYVAALGAKAGFIICPLGAEGAEAMRRSAWVLRGLDRPVDIIGVNLPILISPTADGVALRAGLCEAIVALAARSEPTDPGADAHAAS